VCKSCMSSIWKIIENVESIPCAKCGKPIRAERILKESESGYDYRLLRTRRSYNWSSIL
jgi:hypothetical protein